MAFFELDYDDVYGSAPTVAYQSCPVRRWENVKVLERYL